MDVKACDRCGEIYPINVNINYEYTIVKKNPEFDGYHIRHVDLCDKCAKELDAFMHPERPIVTVGRR